MNGANSLEEEEKTPLHFCPVCLNKLNYLFNFEMGGNYERLIGFFKKNDIKDELKWYEDYLNSIENQI